MKIKRESAVLAFSAAVGFLLVPMAVFLTGQEVFGPYRDGAGMLSFYADFQSGLLAGDPIPWIMFISPYFLVQWLRLLALPLRGQPGKGEISGDPPLEQGASFDT